MRSRSECHIPSATLGGETWHAVGWLTVPDHMARDELQVLVHGATYDHRYWDWPLEPERYSYVDWAATRGYATLVIDRVGCGASSKPPGRQSTLAAQARVLHDIVTAARGPGLGGQRFNRVVLVGHSMGSALSVAEASEYHDVDAVVLTGSLGMDARTLNNDPRADMFYRPALDDPSQRHLTGLIDDAYLSPTPESRLPMFYVESSADPRVIELDEAIKGTMTRGEISDIGTVSDRAAEIRVPVLVLVGEHDALMFDHETETDTYQSTRRSASKSPDNFTFEVVPGAGHNLNLHRQAHDAYSSIQTWLDAIAGLSGVAG